VLREEARDRLLKLRDAAVILRPRLRAEEISLQIPGGRMSDSLVNLLLGQLLRDEPPLAESEFASVEDLLDVLILARWHEIGFSEHSNTSRRGFAILDEPEGRRCFNVLIRACLAVSCAQFQELRLTYRMRAAPGTSRP
jgi:hypothetical protein